MPRKAVRQATIFMLSGPSPHLHIVCNNPVDYPRKQNVPCVLVVNFSSVDETNSHDVSCLVEPGDHPFITRSSYIIYRKAQILHADSIEEKIAGGEYTQHRPCSDELFKRIIDGALASPFTPTRAKRFIEKYC